MFSDGLEHIVLNECYRFLQCFNSLACVVATVLR